MTKNTKQELFVFFLFLGVTIFLWLSTLSFGFFSDDYRNGGVFAAFLDLCEYHKRHEAACR